MGNATVKSLRVLVLTSLTLLAACTSDAGPDSLGNAPDVPSEPMPQDGATDVATNVKLRWRCHDPDPGDALFYDVYFGTDNPPQTKAVSGHTEQVLEMNGLASQ